MPWAWTISQGVHSPLAVGWIRVLLCLKLCNCSHVWFIYLPVFKFISTLLCAVLMAAFRLNRMMLAYLIWLTSHQRLKHNINPTCLGLCLSLIFNPCVYSTDFNPLVYKRNLNARLRIIALTNPSTALQPSLNLTTANKWPKGGILPRSKCRQSNNSIQLLISHEDQAVKFTLVSF